MKTHTFKGTRYYGEEWWRRTSDGTYAAVVLGAEPGKDVRYELEKRRKNVKDGTPDTGWYLYGGDRFGDWVGRTLPEAIAAADDMVADDCYGD